jgi:hypothetical protein
VTRASSRPGAPLAALLAGALLLHSAPSAAQPAGGDPAETQALDAALEKDGGDDEAEGDDVVGIALMVIGGGLVAVGATILVIDASTEAEPGGEGSEGVGVTGDPGSDELVPALGVGLLVGGAAAHLIGVVIAFGGSDADDEEERQTPAALELRPVVGPGYGALRGTF